MPPSERNLISRPRECQAAHGSAAQFPPELIEALEFKAARCNDPTLSASKLLRELNRSGKREVLPDAPMPFRKEWNKAGDWGRLAESPPA